MYEKYIYIVATEGKKVAAMYFFKKRRKYFWKQRLLPLVLTAFCAGISLTEPVLAAQEPELYATAAVLMDADTGRVLYGKNGETFLSNASTTKIMTCILALENASLEEQVEVSAYAAGMPKVKLYIKEGEHFRLGDLLYSLMLESHNDAAVAIAEHVGGSMEGFASMMNKKAKEIGCENTWFITPNGLDATQTLTDEKGNSIQRSHGTTAEDLARIMAYCVFYSPKSETFLEITRTSDYSFANEEGRSFSCTNHNAFLGMMDGVLSGKTGFTNKAGYCYVGALERDGKRFTIALLACGWPNHKTWKWADSRELFSYGLENYVYHRLDEVSYDKEVLNPVPVINGQSDRIGGSAWVKLDVKEGRTTGYAGMDCLAGAGAEKDFEGLMLSEGEKIEVDWEVEKSLQAPVEAGSVIGCIRYSVNGECLKELDIVTVQDVPKIDFAWCFLRVLEKYIL